MKVYNRADIVNFMGISDGSEKTYQRMQGFTDGGKSSNPTTYDRRYIDERTERSDVTGFATEIAYAFDRIEDNAIHDELAQITDDEIVGVTKEILTVNFNKKTGESYEARLRSYSVIPDTDGDSNDAYTYSGTFHAAGDIKKGTATVSADGLTATFTPETSQVSVASVNSENTKSIENKMIKNIKNEQEG